MWLAEEAQWARLASALVSAGEAGIDTETYGQPDKTSPQHRARVHCWSIAILGERRNPRGYREAGGVVLPALALEFEPLRTALRTVKLWAHNAPHDYHSLRNGQLELAIEDTLQWARVAVPGRTEYGLKAMEQWALGKPLRPTFKQMVTHPVEVTRVTTRRETRCVCGKVPCRARATAEWWDTDKGWFRHHERVETEVATEHRKTVDVEWGVQEFVPGHERWDAWVAYALADAVSGIEIVDWLRNRRGTTRRDPWITLKP